MSLLTGKWIGSVFTQEVPTGTIDGVNTSFSLSQAPHSNASVMVILNGLILYQGVDYTISGTSITMTNAPTVGQNIYSFYVKY